MDRRLFAIFTTVFLDATGTGLILPVLPNLLRAVTHQNDLGWRFGAFFGLYGLMQFLSTPLLGALSDRIGRRPVLLLAMAGASVDYLFMVFAPTLSLLFVGRAVAGATAASMSVATAYVTDITPQDHRARDFGRLSAVVGLGLIAGPAIGGLLGMHWMRLPFLAAAIFNGANLLFVAMVLPEPASSHRDKTTLLNPFAPLRWALHFPAISKMIGAFAIIVLVGNIAGAVWVIYGEDRFMWSSFTVGVSLAAFGLFHAVVQAFLAGPITENFGERAAILVGMAGDVAAYAGMAFVAQGWMAFALVPLFSLGGVGMPALQSLLSRRVEEDHQGRLQGLLGSLNSLAGVIAPLLVSFIYFGTRHSHPGFIWLLSAVLYLTCLPLVLARRRPVTAPETAPSPSDGLAADIAEFPAER
jgi:DHA1 family tetracycline resistance protein-like MFS transporter